jgi:DNA polymerase-3 subunit alpha
MYLDDGHDRVEMGIYQEGFQAYKHLLEERAIRVVSGKIRFEEFIDGWRLQVSEVKDIDRLVEHRATSLVIHWLERDMGELNVDLLRSLLEPHRTGRCEVKLVYTGNKASAQLEFGDAWRVRPSGELRDKLAEILGIDAFRFDYQSTAAG